MNCGIRRAAVSLLAVLVLAGAASGDDTRERVQAALKAVRPSLVLVEVQGRVTLERVPGLGEGGHRLVRAEASGVVVSADGLVAFAAARLDPAGRAFALLGSRARPEVERITIARDDGRTCAAEFVGRDEATGLAFARIAESARAGLVPQKFEPGVAAKLEPGDELAILSLSPRALGRAPRVDLVRVASQLKAPRALLALTPQLPHALGGVVVRLESGAAVGVVVALPEEPAADDAAKKDPKDVLAPENLAAALAGYVLPAEEVSRLTDKPPVEARGVAILRQRAWLGLKVEILTRELAKARGLVVDAGVIVTKVYPAGPGEKAGLKVDDVLTRLDGEPIDPDPGVTFETLVQDLGVGTKVKLTVFRGGKAADVEAALAASPKTREEANRERISALGINAREITFFDRDELGLKDDAPGLVVESLDPDGPAARAGLREKDLIETVDDKPVHDHGQAREAIGSQGERTLGVRRGAEKLSLKLRR